MDLSGTDRCRIRTIGIPSSRAAGPAHQLSTELCVMTTCGRQRRKIPSRRRMARGSCAKAIRSRRRGKPASRARGRLQREPLVQGHATASMDDLEAARQRKRSVGEHLTDQRPRRAE